MGIYVDNSATTKVRPEVRDAMLPYLNEQWGNPSSLHELGHNAHEAIAQARAQVAKLLNCLSEEIYFTANGTMSNNIALLGRARFIEANRLGKHLITTTIEHPSILGPVKYLGACGWKVTYLPVDHQGIIAPEILEKAITEETSIISIGWANNEIGSIQPIQEMSTIARRNNIFFHTDAIQAIGKLELDVKKKPVDSLSISGHKFHAPKGIGALYVKASSNVMPITFGGGQEQGLFSGTEAVPNIVGMGKAAELSLAELDKTNKHLQEMQILLMERLSALPNIKFTGPEEVKDRLPGHVSLVVPGRTGEALILRADLHGIYLSSGSACHNSIIEPSHVLAALKLGHDEALGALRISFGRFNTFSECEEVASTLETILRSEYVGNEFKQAGQFL